jgi:sulfate/thiosulfate transport system substrate-binding protein
MRTKLPLLAVLALALVAAAGCGGASDSKTGSASASSGGSGDGGTISLVAYSTPQVVYDEVIPLFNATEEGAGVTFKSSYGASGDQSRSVEGGLKADYVSFSTEPDMTRLVDAGIVGTDWAGNEHKGQIATSIVSFVVRKGNPKNIRTWDDLVKPGVEVVTPNPFTSGAAKWNLLGGYAAKSDSGKDPQAGLDYLRTLITENVVVQDKSGREALQTFTGGTGDVLLSYEYEAITAQKKGETDIEYVIPDDSIRIETLAAVTEGASPAAQAFLDFALSPEAQQKFADWGYRPVDEATFEANEDRFPTPPTLRTIADLGGWDTVNADLFDPETGSVAKIEEEAGVSTAS